MSGGVALETFFGLPVFPVRDVLSLVALPSHLDASSISSKWRCVLAPRCAPEDSGKVMALLDAGIPFFCTGEDCAPPCSSSGGGGDGVSLVTSGEYNHFARPQIAVKNGWGSPGTVRDHSTFHVLVKSFSNVFDIQSRKEVEADADVQKAMETAEIEKAEGSEEQARAIRAAAPLHESDVLELQMFHREGHCHLPPHAPSMSWPDVLEHKVVCDVATVATQAGFQRWWEVNDCGELVLQAALPASRCPTRQPALVAEDSKTNSLKEKILKDLYASMSPTGGSSSSLDNSGLKLYICGSRGSYDWFVHDDATLSSGSVVCMDLFNTSDAQLPKDPNLLPILIIGVLEGGGMPLLIPPNLLTTTIMLRDGVTVEQRAISYLWLDDVSYFLHRCKWWSADPHVYPFVEEDLHDESYVVSVLIPLLYELYQQASQGEDASTAGILQRRLVASLFAIATQAAHFAMPESSRKSLLSTLTTDNASMSAVLHAPLSSPLLLRGRRGQPARLWSLKEMLEWYWDIRQFWPKSGCVLRVPTFFPEGRRSDASSGSDSFLPVVYPPLTCSPVFGSEEATAEATLGEYLAMKKMEAKPRELHAYLTTRKSPVDDVLEELF